MTVWISLNSNDMDKMTKEELKGLTKDYIYIEGYTDLRSILIVMKQEYPDQFDRKEAILAIREALKEEGL